MENKSHALMAGLFTIALLTAAVLIAMWFNRDREEWVPYQIATTLTLTGLNPQAAVRYRGLDVGKVDDISFDPQVPGQLLVRIRVQPNTPITKSTFATLGYQGVTGIAYVQLDDDGSSKTLLRSSTENIARIEMRPSLLDQLQSRGLAILEQTEEVVKRVGTLLEPANQQTIITAFDNIGKAAAELQTIPRQLQPTLAKLPALTTQAQRTMASLSTLSANASKLTGNLDNMATRLQQPNGAIESFTDTARRIGSVADRLEYETLPLASDVRSSLRALNRTLDSLSDRPQSVLFGSRRAVPGPGEPGFVAPPTRGENQ